MIIGLAGLAGSGKTTAAAVLVAHNFVCIPFAAPLKRMFAALRLAPEDLEDPRAWRETPHALLCGKTPRQALQTLGTEWGREQLGPDFWVRLWAEEALKYRRVVADDVRFANEAAAIRQAGGQVFRIARASAGSASGARHPSESQDFSVDAVIDNDGSPSDLAARLAALLI